MKDILLVVIKLLPIGLISIVLSFGFNLAQSKTKFGKISYMWQQIIIGVAFGIASCCGTEFGVVYDGFIINVRDAAPICAGILFGGPAGIIAGVIGGVERWFAVLWGAGTYTRLACTISTIISGIYAAVIRKYVFDNKRPGFSVAFLMGVVMEVLHMTIVLLTKLNDAAKAYEVVKICTIPMAIATAVVILLSLLSVSFIGEEKTDRKTEVRKLSYKIQKRLLVAVILAFAVTTAFLYVIQTGISEQKARDVLSLNIEDASGLITENANEDLVDIAMRISYDYSTANGDLNLLSYLVKYGISEINIVDSEGIIIESTVPEYLGFDMASGEQSAEFLCLLDGELSYVQELMPNTYGKGYQKYAAMILREGGFVQIGINFVIFEDKVEQIIAGITGNRHIGETGYYIITDMKGRMVSAPEAFSEYEGEQLTSFFTPDGSPEEDVLLKGQVNGVDVYYVYSYIEGYYAYAIQEATETTYSRDMEFYINSYMEILVFALLYALFFILINRQVIRSIHKVNKSLEIITDGDLEEKVDVRQTIEFEELSDDINHTVDALKGYIDEVAKSMEKELDFAKSIQMSVLPNTFPPYPNHKSMELHARMDTAKEVGGDFYDYFWIGEDQLVILIADVSGKGVPAALFMMNAKAALKSRMETRVPVNEAMAQANDFLCQGNDAGMFVTCWMCVVNTSTGHVQYANAGHNPPLLRMGNGQFDYLKCRPGLVLAGMDGVPYRLNEFDLEPGSMLYLYTDGVTEATDANNELYGEDRLVNFVNSIGDQGAWELCDMIKEDVDRFVGEAPQFDDITMVCFKFIQPEQWQANFLSSVQED